MDELVKMSLEIHMFFMFVAFLFAVVNLMIVKKVEDYISMTKKVEMFTPLYYTSFSIVVFTGFVIWAVFHFRFKFSIYLMLIASIIIIVGAFKAYKLFKKTRIKDIVSQNLFREFAYKKYILDIALIVFTALLAFASGT